MHPDWRVEPGLLLLTVFPLSPKKMYRGGKSAARGGRGAAAAGPRQASLFEAFGRSASQASPAVGAGGQGTQGSIRVDGAAPR